MITHDPRNQLPSSDGSAENERANPQFLRVFDLCDSPFGGRLEKVLHSRLSQPDDD
jgi:hypothetical protein